MKIFDLPLHPSARKGLRTGPRSKPAGTKTVEHRLYDRIPGGLDAGCRACNTPSSLPRATEQNSGCCCKISDRKLFSHSFQWFSFRPVSAVISQQNLDSFCSIACILPFASSLIVSVSRKLYHESRIKSSRDSTSGPRRRSASRSFFTRSWIITISWCLSEICAWSWFQS